ncbi:hypothetical protein IHQ56_14025 [Methylobacillus flagellatus]|uniref:hypothetical protein n=1 Tax=Methylobacillus flagellatus TaxID=405 RepID=UPI002853992F|nr:hypothetical protein [Methylobacillus flagellatus]MDR5172936.1 hypothetical protein [Methylobacillus flagellatus]
MDIVTSIADRFVPFEVKCQDTPITPARLKGRCRRGYVITQRWEDFRRIPVMKPGKHSKEPQEENSAIGEVVAIPAPIACYWMSE